MQKNLWPVMLSIGLWHIGYSLYGPFVSLWILIVVELILYHSIPMYTIVYTTFDLHVASVL